MKRIDYIDDCKRIQGLLFANGIEATLAECEEVWETHSADLCASWLVLYSRDEDILRHIMPIVDDLAEY